jgi:hypothetical protein
MVAPIVAQAGRAAITTVRRMDKQRELRLARERRISDDTSRRSNLMRIRARAQQRAETIAAGKKSGHLGGFMFWFVLGIAIIKDIAIDPLCEILITGGLGASATAIGTVVGVPMIVIGWVIKCVTLATFYILATLYFSVNGGIHTSIRVARLILWGLGGIGEFLPVVGMLPLTAVVFSATAFLENRARSREGVTGEISGFVVNHASSIRKI